MKTKRNLIHGFLLLALFLTLPVVVQAQFNFTTNNGAITITGDTNIPVSGVVAIPDNINGYPVTCIGDDAFYNCTNLISVTIPDSVTNIGGYAFIFCYDLTDVTIGNGVTEIGTGAFVQCNNLTNVTIPDSVTSIGDYAFAECTSLTSITIPKSITSIGIGVFSNCGNLTAIMVDTLNSFYISAAGVLFNKSQTMLVEYPGGKAGSYSISNSVTSIGDDAFFNCTSLTGITIPNSVTNIGDDVFHFCTGLTNVTIGSNVANIGDGSFAFCTSLISVTIPNSVTNIGNIEFAYCTNLTGIFFQGDAPGAPGGGVLSSAFYSVSNATVYYLTGTTGWTNPWQGCPTALWNPHVQTNDPSFGVRTNQFGFNIAGSSNLVIVVEACTNFANPVWWPISTNTLNTFVGTNGTSYFSDSQWTSYPSRFYRFRSR